MKTLKKCSWNNDIWLIYDYSIPFSTDVQKVIINSLLAKPFTSTINWRNDITSLVHLHLHDKTPTPHNLRRKLRGRTTGSRSNCATRCEGLPSLAVFSAAAPPVVTSRLGRQIQILTQPPYVGWNIEKKNMGFELIMHLPFAVKSEVKSKAIYLECFCWFQNSSALFQGKFQWELRSVLWFLCSTVYST